MSLFKIIWNLIIWKVFHVSLLVEKDAKLNATVELKLLMVSTLDVNASPSTAALPPSQFTSNRVSSGSLGRALSNSASSQLSVWLKTWITGGNAVNGRNSAPVDWFIPLFTKFYTSQLVQDFFLKSIFQKGPIRPFSLQLCFASSALIFVIFFNSIVHTDCQGFMD